MFDPGSVGASAVSLIGRTKRDEQNRNSLFFHRHGRGRKDNHRRFIIRAIERAESRGGSSDGDQIRGEYGDSCLKTGVVLKEERYTTEARRLGALLLFQHCKALAEQGKDVVCSSISMYQEVRGRNRENIENYREVYRKKTQETVYRRDQKKLYS